MQFMKYRAHKYATIEAKRQIDPFIAWCQMVILQSVHGYIGRIHLFLIFWHSGTLPLTTECPNVKKNKRVG